MRNISNLNIMIKPSSSNCNLNCEYCFYYDEAKNRDIYNYGMMNLNTLENLLKNILPSVKDSISFLFQGGEPTTIGLDFYRNFHRILEEYNINNINLNFSIQTNGILIDHEWMELFCKYNYLVGISLDGIKKSHDKYRLDKNRKATFDRVFKTILKLKEKQIPFNVLTVVNNEVCKYAKEIYYFYKENNIDYIQFIPAIDTFNDESNKSYNLDPKKYGIFLDELFNLWYKDIKNGNFTSIRYFENLIMLITGFEPEACDMVGHCAVIPTIEADGSVYPCDFYAMDEYRLGNINNDSIEDIIQSKKSYEFIKNSYKLSDKCKKCKYLKICRSGCKRYKNEFNENKLCSAFKYFFDKNIHKLIDLSELILNVHH